MEIKTTPCNDIDTYIAAQPGAIRPTLQKLRQVIRKTIPSAEEVISYRMPAFRLHGVVIYFAAFKHHYSIFLRPKYLDPFRKELATYKTSKSAVNIPLNKPVPVKLVTRLTKHAAKENKIAAEKKKNFRDPAFNH
jgi:uncharacterized protein YdhG (YjbR/CyaY superfamily)